MDKIIGLIKDYLRADQPFLTNLATVLALIGVFFTVLHFSGKGLRWVYGYFTRKSLYQKLKPYFSREDIQRATENYIPTQCQNVDPAVAAEPARVHAFALREKLIPFFVNQVFKEKKEDKYFLVLADSGMGKTTFMINLFLKYMRNPFKSFSMKLLPLGYPKTDEQIKSIENKINTVLLLDAFDEDIRAVKDYKARMQEIIDSTTEFQTVIITSRTHFFPSDPDIPEETGLYKFGGNKGEHRFYRLYVSPFNTKDITRYLKRKYPVYRYMKRRKACAIVEKSPDLMVRPMLLAYIDDLLKRVEPYECSSDIYEEMVQRWIQRERIENKKELRRFSEIIARDMYQNQQERGGLYIEHEKFATFAQEHHIQLEEFEMRSRSLLNRSADGKYKFAHKSILEYLLALEIVRDELFRRDFNFDNMEQARLFYREQYFQNWRKFNGRFLLLGKGEYFSIDKLALSELEKIYYLDLDNSQNIDLAALTELKNINTLCLSFNQITDLAPLTELKNIRELILPNNQIIDLAPLTELKNISYLILSNNQITDLSPLTELKNISELHLSNNQITDLAPLKALNNLKYLKISGNPIADKSIIDELKRKGIKIRV